MAHGPWPMATHNIGCTHLKACRGCLPQERLSQLNGSSFKGGEECCLLAAEQGTDCKKIWYCWSHANLATKLAQETWVLGGAIQEGIGLGSMTQLSWLRTNDGLDAQVPDTCYLHCVPPSGIWS